MLTTPRANPMPRYKNHPSKNSKGQATLDAPQPRLVTPGQERRERQIRDELSGETDRNRKAKVTLPTLKFMK